MSALAAPSLSRAPLVEESLASHYWTSVYAPLAMSLAGTLSLLQPSDPASLAAAVARCDPTWSGESRGSHCVFDPASAAAYMAAAGEPLVAELGVALLTGRPVDVRGAAFEALAVDGPIAAAARAAAGALGEDATYAAARGKLVVEQISLATAAGLREGASAAAAAAQIAHAGVGLEGEGEREVSAGQLEDILKPFRK